MNNEARALPWFALDCNSPVMCPDRFLHDGQAQPSAAACLFGREKRLKNLRQMVRLDAVSGISNFDCYACRFVETSPEGDRVSG